MRLRFSALIVPGSYWFTEPTPVAVDLPKANVPSAQCHSYFQSVFLISPIKMEMRKVTLHRREDSKTPVTV